MKKQLLLLRVGVVFVGPAGMPTLGHSNPWRSALDAIPLTQLFKGIVNVLAGRPWRRRLVDWTVCVSLEAVTSLGGAIVVRYYYLQQKPRLTEHQSSLHLERWLSDYSL